MEEDVISATLAAQTRGLGTLHTNPEENPEEDELEFEEGVILLPNGPIEKENARRRSRKQLRLQREANEKYAKAFWLFVIFLCCGAVLVGAGLCWRFRKNWWEAGAPVVEEERGPSPEADADADHSDEDREIIVPIMIHSDPDHSDEDQVVESDHSDQEAKRAEVPAAATPVVNVPSAPVVSVPAAPAVSVPAAPDVPLAPAVIPEEEQEEEGGWEYDLVAEEDDEEGWEYEMEAVPDDGTEEDGEEE